RIVLVNTPKQNHSGLLGAVFEAAAHGDGLDGCDLSPQIVSSGVVHLAGDNEVWFDEILELHSHFRISQPRTGLLGYRRGRLFQRQTSDLDIADHLNRDKPVRLNRCRQVIFRRIPEMDFDDVVRLNAIALFARRESGLFFSAGAVRRGAGGYRNAAGHKNWNLVETHPKFSFPFQMNLVINLGTGSVRLFRTNPSKLQDDDFSALCACSIWSRLASPAATTSTIPSAIAATENAAADSL